MLNTLYIALGMPPSKKSHKLGLFAKPLLASEIEAPSQIESASQIYFTLQNEAL